MTREREEAIKHIENIIPYVGENIKESLNMAIKALNQQDIFDKIRIEIEKIKKSSWFNFDDYDMEIYEAGLNDALTIINKHKAESEKIKI